jgi:hypothetical protein
MRFIVLPALVLAAGCSGSPTSPSPLTELPVAQSLTTASPGAGASDDESPRTLPIRWDVSAPGCSPPPAPNPLPDPNHARLSPGQNGMTVASWWWQTSGGRSVLLVAHFLEHEGMLKLCSWDTSDV